MKMKMKKERKRQAAHHDSRQPGARWATARDGKYRYSHQHSTYDP
jgi:hypothetical protein